ncbi:MAG: hypothetical protein ACOX0I_01315 [Bacilli bacterium]|jgi:hypothetical protein
MLDPKIAKKLEAKHKRVVIIVLIVNFLLVVYLILMLIRSFLT